MREGNGRILVKEEGRVLRPAPMSLLRIPFPSAPWTAGSHSLERKKAAGNVALLEFLPGFQDPNWCTHGHYIFVVSGVLDIATRDEVFQFSAGEACTVEPLTEHRAQNSGDGPVTLFVVSIEDGSRK